MFTPRLVCMVFILVTVASSACGLPCEGTGPEHVGQWDPMMHWDEVIPEGFETRHAVLLHTGKVLCIDPGQFFTQGSLYLLFDPANDSISAVYSIPFDHNVFCSGHSQLPDGRILFQGGEWTPAIDRRTSPFDPSVGAGGHGWNAASCGPRVQCACVTRLRQLPTALETL